MLIAVENSENHIWHSQVGSLRGRWGSLRDRWVHYETGGFTARQVGSLRGRWVHCEAGGFTRSQVTESQVVRFTH